MSLSPSDHFFDDDDLDIILEEPKPPLSTETKKNTPLPRGEADVSTDVIGEINNEIPMIRAGACMRCGYALQPFETRCPRCANQLPSSPEPPADPRQRSFQGPQVAVGSYSKLIWVVCTVLIIVLVGFSGFFVWSSPTLRARRVYQAGLRLQLAGQHDAARQHYHEALALDPHMGLAAFSMGTTYLGFGSPQATEWVTQLTQAATWGHTQELDEADRWFRQAIDIARQLPSQTKLMDERVSTPIKLQAYSRAALALTALIRYSAALQADQLDDAMAWLQVAGQEAQTALASDPSNDSANQLLKVMAGLN